MTCMDSYVGRKEKQHSVKTIPVYREVAVNEKSEFWGGIKFENKE